MHLRFVCVAGSWTASFNHVHRGHTVVQLLGGPQAGTPAAKNYAVEIPPEEYSPGTTVLQAYLSQCKGPLPAGSPIFMTTGKPPPNKLGDLFGGISLRFLKYCTPSSQ